MNYIEEKSNINVDVLLYVKKKPQNQKKRREGEKLRAQESSFHLKNYIFKEISASS